MKYIFLRHGKLDLPYADHSEMPFKVFRDLGMGVMNPPIDAEYAGARIQELKDSGVLSDVSRILCSPAVRCVETANMIAGALGIDPGSLRIEPLLAEVRFDLDALNENNRVADALASGNMRFVNGAVFSSILKGDRAEHAEAVCMRVSALKRLLIEDTEQTLCITHDFFMRFIELSITQQISDAAEITSELLDATQRNGYIKGFETDDSFTEFVPVT